jgi:predicted transcriptional regulator
MKGASIAKPRTQRHVTAWIAGGHGFLESSEEKVRRDCKAQRRQMVLDEIESTQAYWQYEKYGSIFCFLDARDQPPQQWEGDQKL